MAIKGKTGRGTKTRKTAKKTRKPKKAKAAAGIKPDRVGKTRVKFGLHGLGKIMTAIHDAKLGKEFGEHLGPEGVFVKLDRQSLENIKVFVNSKPELSDLAETVGRCDCPPDDPGCVYIPG
jgi:hypothetical protein